MVFGKNCNEFKFKRVIVFAHSLGNQLAVETLRELEAKGRANYVLDFIMAAPDIDTDVFRNALPALNVLGANITQYVSKFDKALKFSSAKAGAGRVGLFQNDRPKLFAGVTTIDISNVAKTFSMNHWPPDNHQVTQDIKQLFANRTLAPNVRSKSMEKVDYSDKHYWRLNSQ